MKLTPLALTIALVASPTAAQDTMSALTRAERAYHSLETLSARFTQTIVNPMLGDPEVSHGTLFLMPPSRFAMRFSDPAGDRIVVDGTWLWAYSPSAVPGQVVRQPIPNRGAASPNLLAQFVDRPLEHYRAYYVGEETLNGELVDIVRLVPRREDLPFREALISISRETGLVLRLIVQEVSGQSRTLVFSELETNQPIPETELQFTVPAGVRIVTP
ncbi:MAG: outer membrane lipoprotein carrier protein LolA [Gemmatimonadota bacterium]|nr:MAG: outer membrane lipoprotein carrier protein LolA [Gemmatimonadota bacterium]